MVKPTLLIATLLTSVLAGVHNIFPKPTELVSSGNTTVVISNDFQVSISAKSRRLKKAGERYEKLIQKEHYAPIVPLFKAAPSGYPTVLKSVKVEVEDGEDCDLTIKTDESYSIEITDKATATIKAKTIYGAMHGLESFSQLVQYDKKSKTSHIPATPLKVNDKPLYPHRGILIDTNRNWMPVETLKRTIDAMSYNKLNVFHWHILDAHDFNFKSKSHPELWKAMDIVEEDQLYTYDIIKDLVEYGLERGVRIIPEVEAPAHAYTLGKAFPEIATSLDMDEWDVYAAEPPSGQIDPTNPKSHKIVADLIDEFVQLFPDQYIHLSGDEVNNNAWNNSATIREYIAKHNVTFDKLLGDFNLGMQAQAKKHNKSVMVWEEILLNHNVTLPSDALVQVWLGASDTKKVIQRGHDVIASSYQYWYLDCGHGAWIGDAPSGSSWCDPYKHWQIVYTYDLIANLTATEAKKVKGGEVTAWSEQIDAQVIDKYLWPRASAASEVLWSGNRDDGKVRSTKHVLPRLNDWRFRLVNRGIGAEPLQPLWCVKNPYRCDSTTNIANVRVPYVPKQ
ncbi:glycoside hydrolase family 20 protein [Conidiobolus coronatus NRRL 28638]|uniref:Beta-hexosaminidase n=1 Tax=Conidiobolus coronatus (strain ATCC 28846 / CBS 209.66 / NRRL 28638) TaxID=796925 RepID=A0A137PHU8_CONC2|nr:glycoside hydrolase family 20 protein [Conidiobolus coronatus NRRL 28638]|eukprot:KXN74560.1 glycoside hydrolase family 20 protein [Conidiobolus coronatus NRRL 28638]